jgi:hypothetical protein
MSGTTSNISSLLIKAKLDLYIGRHGKAVQKLKTEKQLVDTKGSIAKRGRT